MLATSGYVCCALTPVIPDVSVLGDEWPEVGRTETVKRRYDLIPPARSSLGQDNLYSPEDPANNFNPSPGTITAYHCPGGPGVRVDSQLFQAYTVPPYYDSLIGKLITWGVTREDAIRRMQRALGEMRIEGVKTTIPFHQKLLRDRSFIEGRIYTRYIEEEFLAPVAA